MDLQTFYNTYNTGKSIAKVNGEFAGECVSLISRYLVDCFGLNPGAWGNARDYILNTNPNILAKFDKIQTNQFKNGDIGVWDDANKRFGHIAIWFNGKWMNQANNGRKYLTLDNISLNYFLGVLRPKNGGGSMITTKEQLDRLYLAVLTRPRGAGEGEDVYLGKDSGWVFDDLYNAKERTARLQAEQEAKTNTAKTVVDLTATVIDLKSKLDEANSKPPVVQDSLANDTNLMVKSIKETMERIFK